MVQASSLIYLLSRRCEGGNNLKNKYIRKPVVFNRQSAWHMEVLRRIENESNNFSGYVMSILKAHFDIKPELEKPEWKEDELDKKEQPKQATRYKVDDTIITPPKLFKP